MATKNQSGNAPAPAPAPAPNKLTTNQPGRNVRGDTGPPPKTAGVVPRKTGK
jgi:hypothetical protein